MARLLQHHASPRMHTPNPPDVLVHFGACHPDGLLLPTHLTNLNFVYLLCPGICTYAGSCGCVGVSANMGATHTRNCVPRYFSLAHHNPLCLPSAASGIQSAAGPPAFSPTNPGNHPTVHPCTNTPPCCHFCFSPCTGTSTYASFSCCNGVACADCLEVRLGFGMDIAIARSMHATIRWI